MTFGLDPWPLAIKLPIAGRLGMASGRGSSEAVQ